MKTVVLTGGVGGAKLVLGLMQIITPGDLTAIVNTGDDFRHLGLHVSPDIDTLLYTLAGKANVAQGWGREGETWSFMAALRELGGQDWFALGDGDLALHVLRTEALGQGRRLSEVTKAFARAWGLDLSILPMSDDRVATWLDTDEGRLAFQPYFVARRCAPRVSRIEFEGAEAAQPTPGLLAAIAAADAVLIAPSNPYLSVDPILAVPGVRTALANAASVVAVSPLIGGQSVKGPTAKLMAELGVAVTNQTIADHYHDFLDGLVINRGDAAPNHLRVARTDTLMKTAEDRTRVAAAAVALAGELSRV